MVWVKSIDLKKTFYDDIDFLSKRLIHSKIIASCRTGELDRSFSSFNVLQICPLTDNEVRQIADKWLREKTSEFLAELNKKTYSKLATRPIYLFYLIRLARGGSELPEMASLGRNENVKILYFSEKNEYMGL